MQIGNPLPDLHGYFNTIAAELLKPQPHNMRLMEGELIFLAPISILNERGAAGIL